MIVYKSRRFAMRRYRYGGSGIVDMIGSLLARYATKAMLTTAANMAMRGTMDPVQLENVALKDPKVLLEKLVKWDLLEAEVEFEHVVKKVTRETLVVLVNKDL